MHYRYKHITLLITFLSFIFIAGCTTPTLYEVSKGNTANVKNNVEAKEQKAYPRPPAVLTENKAYVDTTPVSLIKTPHWLKRKITVHGNNLPFSFYVSQILHSSHAINTYDETVNKGKLISMDYEGTAYGALNELSAQSGYFYNLDKKKNEIDWSSFQTKVFDISFMPGDVQYQLGAGAGGLSISGNDDNGSSSSSGGGFDFSQDTQYSNLTGTISIWKDLTGAIKSLLSEKGTAQVSESTTTVTVHDHPANVKAIGDYIKVMNKELSQQVRIHVQLLEVRLGKNFNYGINWDLVRNTGKNSWRLAGNLADNANNTGTFSPIGITFSSTGKSWGGSSTIIQALQQQGDVSLITQPTVTTMNDQVATISIQQQQAYLSGGDTTLNDNSSTSSLDTSTVTTGFNLYLLPKIQKEKVFLQISSVLSNLTNMATFNANTGETGSSETDNQDTQDPSEDNNDQQTNTTTNPGVNVVQLPQTALRSFNQRSVIPNGATLVLAGYIEKGNESNQSKFANVSLLGGKGATTKTVELVMLITPIILSENENDMAPVTGYAGLQGS